MACITHQDKIFVAGHTGLVGSAIIRTLQKRGYKNIITRTHEQLNFLNQSAVEDFFSKEKPDVVFVAAAKVGGIHANNVYRADFIYENLQIQNNIIWNAHKQQAHRLVFLGSSCIYPKQAKQPMQENCLLTSPLEYTNRPYAIAKISGVELINSLRLQYRRDYFSVMPTNLYGPNDNFHPENSHVFPALVRRFLEAKEQNKPHIDIWGSGTPRREFLHSDDCADALVYLCEKIDSNQFDKIQSEPPHWCIINIGGGDEVTIMELAQMISEAVGYEGNICFDSTKPDGTIRKLLNVDLLERLGWKSKIRLAKGIESTIEWYKKNRH